MPLIGKNFNFEEGELLLRWIDNRLLKNKNVILLTTGATGSGKSYVDLRIAELIHRRRFNEDYPIENCCFTLGDVAKGLTRDVKLRKGETLILEEAGVNAGSGDWQNKLVKMFNYVLQSFRSMNIVLIMNLPYRDMLAKQARQLIHANLETAGIDFNNNQIRVKALFHQFNERQGKSYWKYLKCRINGKVKKIERMSFSKPSEDLSREYEAKKLAFLKNLTREFIILDEKSQVKRKPLTETQEKVMIALANCDAPNKQAIVAKMLGKSVPAISKIKTASEKKGYTLEEFKKKGKTLENQPIQLNIVKLPNTPT